MMRFLIRLYIRFLRKRVLRLDDEALWAIKGANWDYYDKIRGKRAEVVLTLNELENKFSVR